MGLSPSNRSFVCFFPPLLHVFLFPTVAATGVLAMLLPCIPYLFSLSIVLVIRI